MKLPSDGCHCTLLMTCQQRFRNDLVLPGNKPLLASLIEFVPLLSLCILDPVRELTHYFRWLNARETYPQCTEAASLISFALSHPFVICHKLNMTLYCASITTVHAFPFRVASMPAVRYDLSGGLPTCLWLFIYQDYSVICISKKLM